jgi:LCP family protein required for cell wall assembly
MKQNRPFSAQRFLWKSISLALAVVLAGMLAMTGIVHHFLSHLGSGSSAPFSGGFSGSELQSYLNPRDVNWTQLSTDVRSSRDNVLNILLIGKDRRENESLSRADSILLCSFRKDTKELTMTSFLRDLYVPIPGRESDRINAAYAYGGSQLLKKTLTENFEIPITGVIEVDFSQFSELIDTLGGVEIQLRKDEADLVNKETGSSLSEGFQRLTGQQALSYSRIRKLDADGDFSRTDRQRKVMTALVDSYRDAGLTTLVKLLKQILPMISTDMTDSRLLMLAMEVFPLLPDLSMTSQSIPAPGTYSDKTIDGMAVLVPDMDAVRSLLQETAQ